MNLMKLILYGIYIGIGKVIPGVSGSMIAMTLGVYERGIDSIDNFFKDIKNNSQFLGMLGIGILLSIIFGSKIIDYFLFKYYFFTMFLFLGLLFGTTKKMNSKIKYNKKNIFMIIMITIVMFLINFSINNSIYNFNNNLGDYLYVILLGFIDAVSMIIPGISGTAIYMLLGTYNFILEIFSNPFNNVTLLIIFSIGLLSGIILVTKLVNYLFKNKKELIYSIILGFSYSSLIIILLKTIILLNIDIYIILYLIIFLIGFFVGIKIGD